MIDTRVGSTLTTTGTVNYFTLPSLGVGNGERISDMIKIEKIELNHYYIYGDLIGNVCRLIIFQTTGGFAPVGIGDILSPGGTAAPDVTSHVVPYLNGNRVRVLYDEFITCIPGSKSALVAVRSTVKPKIPIVQFSTGGNTFWDGGLWYLLVSDSTVTPSPSISASWRVHYSDP